VKWYLRKVLWRELSLARSWCTRDWIWGRELKLEGLRNLERVEAESERYLASSVMVLPPWGNSSGRFFFTGLSIPLSRVAKL